MLLLLSSPLKMMAHAPCVVALLVRNLCQKALNFFFFKKKKVDLRQPGLLSVF